MKPIATIIATLAMLVLWSAAGAAERAKANVHCKETGEKQVYDCMIMLMNNMLMNKKSGKPITGAKIAVRAAMPTMPMAHNMTPVTAMAMAKPGSYQARLKLEMHGEWALTMDVSGPLRERLVSKLQIGGMGAMKHGKAMPKSN